MVGRSKGMVGSSCGVNSQKCRGGGKMRFKNIEGAIFISKNTIKGVFKI